jgi:hypothetical protein
LRLSVVLIALALGAISASTFVEPAIARPYLASCEPVRCAWIHGTVTQERCKIRLGAVQNSRVVAFREPVQVELDGSPSMSGAIAATGTDSAGRYSLELPAGSDRIYVYAFVRLTFWPTGWGKWFLGYRTVVPRGYHRANIEIDTTYRDCF